MTDRPANVIQAIAAVMSDMKGVGKEGRNKDQGYSFRGIEDVTAVLQPVLGRHCVVIVPRELSHAREHFKSAKGGDWTDDFINIEYAIYGPGGAEDKITAGPFLGIGRDNSDKGANKARSMAYKYMLTEVFCIGDKKDDADENTPTVERAPEAPAGPQQMSESNRERFIATARERGLDDDDIARIVHQATEGRTGNVEDLLTTDVAALRAALGEYQRPDRSGAEAADREAAGSAAADPPTSAPETNQFAVAGRAKKARQIADYLIEHEVPADETLIKAGASDRLAIAQAAGVDNQQHRPPSDETWAQVIGILMQHQPAGAAS